MRKRPYWGDAGGTGVGGIGEKGMGMRGTCMNPPRKRMLGDRRWRFQGGCKRLGARLRLGVEEQEEEEEDFMVLGDDDDAVADMEEKQFQEVCIAFCGGGVLRVSRLIARAKGA